MSTDRIAIVGMAVRCSGAPDIDAFWQLVVDGRQSARLETPRESDVPAALAARDDFVPLVNPIADFDAFDADFFGFSEREAEVMDPQRRMLFETVWSAFEDAGLVPGAARTGTYLAVNQSEYFLLNLASRPDLFDLLGGMLLGTLNGQDFPATHLAYKLDLRGPALNINTACSGSLVAVHSAVNALLARECDVAVAGGASLVLAQRFGYVHKVGGINSRSGRCRPFDAEADGTLPGSGAAAVVLKRLDDALRDGDAIHAVIRGTAVNNDGAAKVGFTAPSRDGQVDVIGEALAVAGVEPDEIGFLETHGTGTALGDALELDALQSVFGGRRADRPLSLGALKASTGHLNAAAGAAALIKAVLALTHRCLPPLANFTRSPVQADLVHGPLRAPRSALPWTADGGPRLAGVSAFGIGGTNAHVILEEAPARAPSDTSARPPVLPASARSRTSLAAGVGRLAAALREASEPIADIAYTLAVGRAAHALRCAAVGTEAAAVALQLQRAAEQAVPVDGNAPDIAFAIAGQGEDGVDALRALYRWEGAYRAAVDACRDVLESLDATHYDGFWRAVLRTQEPLCPRFEATDYQQPLLFVFSYAQVRLFESWGIRPACVLGHSLGEIVAGCVAGLFTLDDALRLVHARGRAMQAAVPGAMLAVFCSEEAAYALAQRCGADVAACNGASHQVLAGTPEHIAKAERLAREGGWPSRRLRVDRAFHSHLIEPALEPLRGALACVRPRAMELPLIGNVDGAWKSASDLADPDYWLAHARRPVRFARSLETLSARGVRNLIEIGPGRTLSRLARAHAEAAALPLCVLDVADPAQEGATFAYQRLAAAWCAGADVDWAVFHAAERRRRVRLPAYVFDRRRYWIDRAAPERAPQPDACADWLYRPQWRPCDVAAERAGGPASWLVFDDGSNAGLHGLCDTLRAQGDEVIRVRRGDGFVVAAPDVCMRATAHDVVRLATQLTAQRAAARRVLYGWELTAEACRSDDLEFLLELARHLLRGAGDALAVLASSIGTEGAAALGRTALAGALRVVAQEAPGVKTRFVIVDEDADLRRVPAALDGDEAFRELWLSTQWRQRDYVRAHVSESAAAPDFRPDGRYLVVGGLGKVGQILTGALSAQMPLRLALLGRYPVAANCGAERVDLRRPRVDAGAWAAALGEEIAPPSPHHAEIVAAQAWLNRLSVALVQAYATRRLANVEAGSRYPLADFLATLCEAPALKRMAGTMLRVLEEGGVVVREGDAVVVAALSADLPAQLETALASSCPDFAGAAARLLHCAAHFDDVLDGRRSGVSVLYPEGSAQFLRATAPGPAAHGDFRDAVERLRDGLPKLAAATGGRTLRILEIGGGNGSLTRQLAPTLQSLDVSYCFTDIGPTFVQGARRLAAENGYDWICARVLDIESDLGAQGFAPGEFDLIIGFNVLHIAARLQRTIARLSTLLSPGGAFALVETLQWMPWTELVWGLTDDWWRYEDVDVRGDSPLLGAPQWLRVFEDAGFAVARVVAREGAMDGLVVAAVPDAARCDETLLAEEAAVRRDAQVRHLTAAGCSVVCYRGDAGEAGDMQRLQESLVSRFGTLDGMVYAATTGMRAMALIDDIDRRHVRTEFATKVHGLANLEPLCARLTPSFVAVMSSMSSVLGGIGHYGYAAANAVQDAWCRNRPEQGRTRWLALNWDAWGDAEKSFGASVARHGLSGDEAVRALRAALRRDAGQWLISRHSLDARLDQWLRGADAAEASAAADVRAAAAEDASTQQRVIALWKELLGRNAAVEATSDFLALGGDSLQAVQLVSLVRARFGRHVSLAEFVRAPTVANLVALVDARTAWSPLVTLARGSTQSTVVCIHPGGGGIQCYRTLADALGGGRTLHALQSRRFAPDDLPPHRSVEAMAAEYRAAIEAVDDGTPLILLGYCFGGMIAFEIAAQLEAAGRRVARLIIVDGHPPGVDDGFLDQRHFIETQAAMVTMQAAGTHWARDIAALSPEEQAAAVSERIDWSRAERGAEAMIRRAVLEVILTNVAKNVYRPQAVLHCDVDLLRIDDAGFHRDSNAVPHLGWQAFCARPIEIRWVTGEHHQLFDPDRIAPIAAHVRWRAPEGGDMPAAVFVAGQPA